VKDDGDHREDKQQMNEKTGGVKHDKAADPGQHQHQRNHKKHRETSLSAAKRSGQLEMAMKPKGLLAKKEKRTLSLSLAPATYSALGRLRFHVDLPRYFGQLVVRGFFFFKCLT